MSFKIREKMIFFSFQKARGAAADGEDAFGEFSLCFLPSEGPGPPGKQGHRVNVAAQPRACLTQQLRVCLF